MQNRFEKKPSWFHYMKTVLWAFFGIRSARGYEQDIQKLKPQHVVLTGLLIFIIFIMLLLAFVKIALYFIS